MPTRLLLLSTLFSLPFLLLRGEEHNARALPPGRHNLVIHVGADSLDAALFVPSTPAPDSLGFPAMLFVHGFGQTKHADTLSASLWAASGYVTLCYSVRGHGSSSGASDIMGNAERRDLVQVVAFLRSLPGVNPARIGVQGGSQGGLHVLWCAADSLPVAAGTADVISPSWASDLTANGSYRTTLTFLLYNTAVRYGADAQVLRSFLREDAYGSLRSMFTTGRDLDTASLFRARLPIAAFSKWQDHYFGAEGMAAWFRGSVAPRQLYCGTGGHFSDEIPEEYQAQWAMVNRWHERFVAGKENGVDGVPSLTIATSSLPADPDGRFAWEREIRSDWPVAGEPYRLYFSGDSLCTPLRPPARSESLSVRNSWDPSYTLDSALADRFSGARFDAALPRGVHRYVTRPLQNDVVWFGAPRVSYIVGSDADRFPLHCQIFEVEEGGTKHLINRVPLTVREWVPGRIAGVEARGFLHSHRFTRGSRIQIELSNIDAESRPGWGTLPFHLPMFRDVSANLYCDSARSSYIELPLIGDPVLRTVMADLHAECLPPLRRVRVSWNTRGECDNAGFHVMRRDPVGREENAGFVPPAEGSSTPVPVSYVWEDSTVGEGTWSYRVRQVATDGRIENSAEVELQVLFNGVGPGVAFRYGLDQNFPNPFNPATAINFSLERAEHVRLEVVALSGARVALLVDGDLPPGAHSVRWDGSGSPSGAYFYRLTTPSGTRARRMMLLR